MMWSKIKVVSSHFLQHQAQNKDLVCSFILLPDCISACLYQTEIGAGFELFYFCQAPRAAERVRRCCPVLYALHPRHFLLWGKHFQISFVCPQNVCVVSGSTVKTNINTTAYNSGHVFVQEKYVSIQFRLHRNNWSMRR